MCVLRGPSRRGSLELQPVTRGSRACGARPDSILPLTLASSLRVPIATQVPQPLPWIRHCRRGLHRVRRVRRDGQLGQEVAPLGAPLPSSSVARRTVVTMRWRVCDAAISESVCASNRSAPGPVARSRCRWRGVELASSPRRSLSSLHRLGCSPWRHQDALRDWKQRVDSALEVGRERRSGRSDEPSTRPSRLPLALPRTLSSPGAPHSPTHALMDGEDQDRNSSSSAPVVVREKVKRSARAVRPPSASSASSSFLCPARSLALPASRARVALPGMHSSHCLLPYPCHPRAVSCQQLTPLRPLPSPAPPSRNNPHSVRRPSRPLRSSLINDSRATHRPSPTRTTYASRSVSAAGA